MTNQEIAELLTPGVKVVVMVDYKSNPKQRLLKNWYVQKEAPLSLFRSDENQNETKEVKIVFSEAYGKTPAEVLRELNQKKQRPASMPEIVSFLGQYPELLQAVSFIGLTTPSILGAQYVLPKFEKMDKPEITVFPLNGKFINERIIAVQM